MCSYLSTRQGLGAKGMAKSSCLTTVQLCLPERQVINNTNKTKNS